MLKDSNTKRFLIAVIIVCITMCNAPTSAAAISEPDGSMDIANLISQDVKALNSIPEYIMTSLAIYRLHNGFFPTTEQGLEALVTKPTTDPQPKKYLEGGYMRKVPVDPWGNPYIYRCYGKNGPLEVISCGPDGIEGTEDDIIDKTEEIPVSDSRPKNGIYIYPAEAISRGFDKELVIRITRVLSRYRYDNGFYPTTEQGFEALITKPTTDPQPKKYREGGYMKDLPVDPCGNPIKYRYHEENGKIDIISYGPDGIEGTEDDIITRDIMMYFYAPTLVSIHEWLNHYIVEGVIRSGDALIITNITERNKSEWIVFSSSLSFRKPKFYDVPLGIPLIGARQVIGVPNSCYQLIDLWNQLLEELSDAANPDRFQIPYSFAFNLSKEEHGLCETKPDEVLNVIQGKEAILTWITPDIQWGDNLRITYLQEYIRILKENGHVEWAETVESIEGRNYLYENSLKTK